MNRFLEADIPQAPGQFFSGADFSETVGGMSATLAGLQSLFLSDSHLPFLWPICLFGGIPFNLFSSSQPASEYNESSLLLDAEHSKKSTSAPPAQTAFYFYKTKCQTGFTMEMLNTKVGSILLSTRWLCEWLFITCVQLSSQALVSPKIATVRKPKCYFVRPDCSSEFGKTALLSAEFATER